VTQTSSASINQVETLTSINLADMLDNFGLSGWRYGRRFIAHVCRPPASTLARQVAAFDRRVGEAGLQTAAREWLLPYVNRLEVVGAEHVPPGGGVLLAMNHPGLTDALACFAGLPRSDVHFVSADRPFIRTLTHIAQRTFFVSDRPNERLTVVRQVSRFVQQGGAVLICPAGQIEPDPAVMPGAREALAAWSNSLGLLVRLAPRSTVVPTVVSGVIYGPALRHPVTRLRRRQKDRERIAATLQAVWQITGRITRHINVRLEFGPPLPAAQLLSLGDASRITQAVTEATASLIARAEGAAASSRANCAYQ
jgi:1-acyl-sn-glycerol-3-phosphate acyltransferase